MDSVSEYVTSIADIEPTLRRFQEMISKYQFMEVNVQKRAQGLREKLPEMRNTLDTVRFLQRRRDMAPRESQDGDAGPEDEAVADLGDLETTFSLSDTLYAKAKIRSREIDEVYLWLGANVMVAYPLAEAKDLLSGKLEKAKESLAAAEEDLEFLRIQTTTLEVATARVYNWDVMEKRKLRAEGKLEDESRGEDGDTGEG